MNWINVKNTGPIFNGKEVMKGISFCIVILLNKACKQKNAKKRRGT